MPGKMTVGFLVSYDYPLLFNAIPFVYEQADLIILALDKNRKTWNGADIEVGEDFFNWIKQNDPSNKIRVYEDSFYVPDQTTMECEVRERKMMVEQAGPDNWYIHLDADEYFVEFDKLVDFLNKRSHLLKNPEKTPIEVCAMHVNVFKRVESGMLIVNRASRTPVATNWPSYRKGRKTGQPKVYTDFLILHECLSRSYDELNQKLTNWGHNVDIDKDKFLARWSSIDATNYKEEKDLFYMRPASLWPGLQFVKTDEPKDIAPQLRSLNLVPGKFYLWKKNLGQWFKAKF